MYGAYERPLMESSMWEEAKGSGTSGSDPGRNLGLSASIRFAPDFFPPVRESP